VTEDIDPSELSHAQKNALILSLAAQLRSALARVDALERRVAELTRPPKTPDNSGTPPAKGHKPNRALAGKPARKGRPGVARALHPDPDRVVEAWLDACPGCHAALSRAAQSPQMVYDRIELPKVKPDVTRVHLLGGRCGCCGLRAIANAPAGLEPGSPFGRSIEAMVIYLHYTQAIGLERLRALMSELFGLSISEGALSNILARAQAKLTAAAGAVATAVTAARVVCCDETSARVAGRTWWEWVFATKTGVLHLIRPSRGGAVPRAVFSAVRPGVWVSDALGSQRGHAEDWQMCLAHLLRDAQFAIDCGDAAFAAPLRRLLLRAIAIGRRRDTLKDDTLSQYRADLDRRLDRIMAAAPAGREGETLRRRIGRDRAHLFVFVTDRDVPPTNNIAERNLRPSVIFRKATNGFRAEWGAATYAACRSVVSTAKLNGNAVLDAIRNALSPTPASAPG
jgi:transposase